MRWWLAPISIYQDVSLTLAGSATCGESVCGSHNDFEDSGVEEAYKANRVLAIWVLVVSCTPCWFWNREGTWDTWGDNKNGCKDIDWNYEVGTVLFVGILDICEELFWI